MLNNNEIIINMQVEGNRFGEFLKFYDVLDERLKQNPLFLKRTNKPKLKQQRDLHKQWRQRRKPIPASSSGQMPRFLTVRLARATLLGACCTFSNSLGLPTPATSEGGKAETFSGPLLLLCCSLFEVLPTEGKDQEARCQYVSIARPVYLTVHENAGGDEEHLMVTFPIDLSAWAKQQSLRGRCYVVIHGFPLTKGAPGKSILSSKSTYTLLGGMNPTIVVGVNEGRLNQCPLAQARELRSSRHHKLRKALSQPSLEAILPLELYWKQHPQPLSLKDQSLRKCWVILNKENSTCARLNGHIKQTKAQIMQVPWANYSGEYAVELVVASDHSEANEETTKKRKLSSSVQSELLKIKVEWGLLNPLTTKQPGKHSNMHKEGLTQSGSRELEYLFHMASVVDSKRTDSTRFSHVVKGKSCIWCKFSARTVEDLLQHLRTFHGLLRYDKTTNIEGKHHISVYNEGETSGKRESLDWFFHSKMQISKVKHRKPESLEVGNEESVHTVLKSVREKPSKGANSSTVAKKISRSFGLEMPSGMPPKPQGKKREYHKRFKLTSQQTEAISQVQKEGQQPARQYYHARTCIPVRPEELDHDSDDDTDDSWLLILSEKLLDEFEDVSEEEKTFMKLWNRHIHSQIVYADSYVPYTCEIFAKRCASIIVQKNMRMGFLLHLINLYDFSLLSAKHVLSCMDIVDSVAKQMSLEKEKLHQKNTHVVQS